LPIFMVSSATITLFTVKLSNFFKYTTD
jgi:hypothetical protein